jgi:outer membrane protein TolC
MNNSSPIYGTYLAKFLLMLWPILVPGHLLGQLTLEQCQEKARDNYPLIKQYQLIEQSKEYTVSNANKSFLPQLSLTAIGGIIDGLPTFDNGSGSSSNNLHLISTVQLNQVIWDGGVTKAKKQVIEANSEIARATLEMSLFGLEDRVNHLFFGVLLINEQIQQLEILRDNLERNLNRVEMAVENGSAFRSDIDEVKVEVLNVAQQVSELEFNRTAYLNMLEALIGEPIGKVQQLVRPQLEAAYANLELARPELKLFQSQEYLYQTQLKMKKSALYPKVGLTGLGTFITPGVGFGSTEIERLLVGGLSLSWKIGGLYTNANDNSLMEINLQNVNLQRETFMFNTNLELIRIQEEIMKYDILTDTDEEILRLKNRITRSYQVKYDNGVSTMSELLDKTNEENMAKQNLITHEIQYQMAIYNYKNISGN